MRRVSVRLGLVAVLWLCYGMAGAQTLPQGGRLGMASVTSADHRFRVSGMGSAENLVLADTLSEFAKAMEDWTGMRLPMSRDQALGVLVQSGSATVAPVLKMQGWDGGEFFQRLVVQGELRLDEEDLLEGVCWLLLNRYAAEHTPPILRNGLGATVPDWLSAGLSQNARPALVARNQGWMAREWAEGRTMRLAEVLKLGELPPGRWREKAYAAAAVEFLFPQGDAAAWDALFQAVGAKRPLDAAWLRQHCAVLAGGEHPEVAWRAALAENASARTIGAWSDRSLRQEERLMRTLTFRPREMVPNVPPEVPEEMFARELTDWRGQEWTDAVAAALTMRLAGLKPGGSAAFGEVLACYGAYFSQLRTAPAEKKRWWSRAKADDVPRPPDDATWVLALNQLWQRAERVHHSFLEGNQARRRYLDSFDTAETADVMADTAGEAVLRTKAQRYVDAFDEAAAGGR